MIRVCLTPSAESDLTGIIVHLMQESVEVAESVFDDFNDAFHKLAANRDLGHYRADLTDEPLRFLNVHQWLIVYRDKTKPPHVI